MVGVEVAILAGVTRLLSCEDLGYSESQVRSERIFFFFPFLGENNNISH